MTNKIKLAIYLAWIMALVATGASLFLSEILHLPPCVLCWYQRICMYPLSILLAVGILRQDKSVVFYALPLAIIGGVIALYHTLLQWNILPESAAPCQQGISCTTIQVNLLGFITIPFMAFTAFTLVVLSLSWAYFQIRRSKGK